MTSTHSPATAAELASTIADAIETVEHLADINILNGDKHWRISRCSDGHVIVFERRRGRRFRRLDAVEIDKLTNA
jgi:hypothetical protein